MSNTIRPDQLTEAVMSQLTEYADMTADAMKDAVDKAAKTVKKEIQAGAPKDTGAYKKSWRIKTTKNKSHDVKKTVYSAKKYRLTHLLEHGHALRNGGRARAFPHIEPAAELGERQLIQDIESALRRG